jgi:hypothetical protein
MVDVDFLQVQSDVSEILNDPNLVKAAVINHYTVSENDYGENVPVFDSQEPIVGVVLSYKKFKKKYDNGGAYNDSSFIFIVDGTLDINNKTDIITLFNDDYKIVNNDDKHGGEYTIAQFLFLKNN